MSRSRSSKCIVIPPFHYIHVKDENKHTYRLVEGPQNFIRQDHETVITGDRAVSMVQLPNRHYCMIDDPVQRNEDGSVFFDDKAQVRNQIGDWEYRLYTTFNEPFPLYPGEKLKKPATLLTTVSSVDSLRIEAVRDFTDDAGVHRNAGD